MHISLSIYIYIYVNVLVRCYVMLYSISRMRRALHARPRVSPSRAVFLLPCLRSSQALIFKGMILFNIGGTARKLSPWKILVLQGKS